MSTTPNPTRKGKRRQLRPCPSRRKTLADRLPIDSVINYARKVHAGNGGKVELGEAIVISICAHFQTEGSVSEAEVMAAYKLVITTMYPERQGEQPGFPQQDQRLSPQSSQPCPSQRDSSLAHHPLGQVSSDNTNQQPTPPQNKRPPVPPFETPS